VNQLRQLMLEELRRRNFADTTIRSYVHGVEALQSVLSSPTRSACSRAHPAVQGDAVQQVEVQPERSSSGWARCGFYTSFSERKGDTLEGQRSVADG
jgi:hypothetical protein